MLCAHTIRLTSDLAALLSHMLAVTPPIFYCNRAVLYAAGSKCAGQVENRTTGIVVLQFVTVETAKAFDLD